MIDAAVITAPDFEKDYTNVTQLRVLVDPAGPQLAHSTTNLANHSWPGWPSA
jgi:hypothetical protein